MGDLEEFVGLGLLGLVLLPELVGVGKCSSLAAAWVAAGRAFRVPAWWRGLVGLVGTMAGLGEGFSGAGSGGFTGSGLLGTLSARVEKAKRSEAAIRVRSMEALLGRDWGTGEI
jgi:hypothetical protein